MKRILNNKGFTLIELVIVIIILGVLATLVGPKMIGSIKTSKVSTTLSNILATEKAAAQYYAENNVAPTQAQIEAKLSKTFSQMGFVFVSCSEDANHESLDLSFTINASGTPSAGVTYADLSDANTGIVSKLPNGASITQVGATNNTTYAHNGIQ